MTDTTEGTGTAQAPAPAAPAPSSDAPNDAPANGQTLEGPQADAPKTSAWKEKIQKLRDAGSLEAYQEQSAAEEEEGAQEEGQPRADNGRFAKKDGEEQLEGEAGQEAAEGAPEGEGGEGTGEEAQDDVVAWKLPGRQPDEDDIELALPRAALEEAGVDVDAITERFKQMRNGFMRGSEFRKERDVLLADRAEFDSIVAAVKADPVGFVTQTVQKPEFREAVARDILLALDDEAFERVVQQVDGWIRDPRDRELERTKTENKRLSAERTREEQSGATKDDLEYAASIRDSIQEIIPAEWEGSGRDDRFFSYAVQALIDYTQKHDIEDLAPADVSRVLAELGVLEDFQLGPDTEQPAGKKPAKDAPTAQGNDPKTRIKRRREAAAVTPAGAGGEGASGNAPPRGQSFKERMSWLRKNRS